MTDFTVLFIEEKKKISGDTWGKMYIQGYLSLHLCSWTLFSQHKVDQFSQITSQNLAPQLALMKGSEDFECEKQHGEEEQYRAKDDPHKGNTGSELLLWFWW